MNYHEKLDRLKENIRNMKSMIVAFSGGVDSTFLLKVAYDELGENVLAITARSSTYPQREFNEAVNFIKQLGANHMVILSEDMGLSQNKVNRCYYCKKELFSKIRNIADENGIKYIADGSNIDDLGDYRPGMTALKELGAVSPLIDAGMTKEDIRYLSKELHLSTWNKPAFACLSSRFPYDQEITKEKLEMVDKAEQFLMDKGFKQVRVRHHGSIARIEVPSADRLRFFEENLMDQIYLEFVKIGFYYTALDLKGYRTGSMNETILDRLKQ